MRELARSIAKANMRRAGIRHPNMHMAYGKWRKWVKWTPNPAPRLSPYAGFFARIRKRLEAAKMARITRKYQRRMARA